MTLSFPTAFIIFVAYRLCSEVNAFNGTYYNDVINRCGTSYHNAAYSCGQECPGGLDSECLSSGEKCYANVECKPPGLPTSSPSPTAASMPVVSQANNSTNHCGLSWIDAYTSCGQECPGGVDAECLSSGEKCYANVECKSGVPTSSPSLMAASMPVVSQANNSTNRCGLSWIDAYTSCGQECPGGVDSECLSSGEKCYASVNCASWPTPTPTGDFNSTPRVGGVPGPTPAKKLNSGLFVSVAAAAVAVITACFAFVTCRKNKNKGSSSHEMDHNRNKDEEALSGGKEIFIEVEHMHDEVSSLGGIFTENWKRSHCWIDETTMGEKENIDNVTIAECETKS